MAMWTIICTPTKILWHLFRGSVYILRKYIDTRSCLYVHEHARSDTHAQPDADSIFHQHALGMSPCTLSSLFSMPGSLLRAVNSLLQQPG